MYGVRWVAVWVFLYVDSSPSSVMCICARTAVKESTSAVLGQHPEGPAAVGVGSEAQENLRMQRICELFVNAISKEQCHTIWSGLYSQKSKGPGACYFFSFSLTSFVSLVPNKVMRLG